MEYVAVLLGLIVVLASVLLWRLFFQPKGARVRGKPILGWNRKPADRIMGDLSKAVANGSLYDYLWRLHKEGSIPVTAFWWRNQRVVSVCSPQAFKDTESLYNRPKLIFGPNFEPLYGSKSIQSVNGVEWKERKKLLHNTIRGQRLVSFVSEFVQVADEIKSKWSTGLVRGGKPVQLKREMFLATLKTILYTSLGNMFKNDDEIEDLANAYHLCKCEMDTRILVTPPPDSPQELSFQKNLKHLKDYLRRMIQVRREQNGTGKELPLLDALLNSGASEDLILSDMLTFMGGFHTSGYYATWTFVYLAQHPYVQEKLYKEIEEKVGDDRNEKLKSYITTPNSYLRQVLDESMRHSTTVNFSAHYSDEDIMVDGHCVSAGTPIIHALGVAMNNKAIWEHPDKFDPDRFAPGSKHAKRGFEYRPFGVTNVRRCPANQFTYMMVSVFVTVLVHAFTLKISDKQDIVKVYGIATSPKTDPLIQVELKSNFIV